MDNIPFYIGRKNINQFRIREKFIPYNLPNLTDQEVNAVIDTLKSSWIAKGPRTVKFEQQFAQFVGAKHAVATNSGTAALHLALLSKGIGSGDKVITTPNMFDIQAALGLVQLLRMNKMQARRKKIAEKYQNEFSRIDAVEPSYIPDYTIHSWHLYIIRIVPELLTINRDRFIIELNKRNIGTSVHFIPVISMSYYQKHYGFKKEDFPNTEKNYERIISLPLYPSLSEEETDYIIDAVRNIVEEYHK